MNRSTDSGTSACGRAWLVSDFFSSTSPIGIIDLGANLTPRSCNHASVFESSASTALHGGLPLTPVAARLRCDLSQAVPLFGGWLDVLTFRAPVWRTSECLLIVVTPVITCCQ